MRLPRSETGLFGFGATLLFALAAGAPLSAFSNPGPVQAPPVLRWIQVSPRPEDPGKWTVSLESHSASDRSWDLAVAFLGTSPDSPGDGACYRQRIRDNELTHFPIMASGAGTLSIRVEDREGHLAGDLRVALARGPSDLPKTRLLVPEWRVTSDPGPREAWVRFDLDLTDTGIVSLAIFNESGTRVRSWPPGLLEAGRTTVLWDGNNKEGEPVSHEVYHLEVREADSPAGPSVSVAQRKEG